MKSLFFLCFALILAPAFGQKTASKPYKIAAVTKNAKLKSNECKIVFRIKKPVLPDDEYYFDVVADGNAMEVTGNKNSFSIIVEAGKHDFHCYMQSNRWYPIDVNGITTKGGHVTTIDLSFKKAPEMTEEKPVIYLYPSEPTAFNVNLISKGKVTFTYPENGPGKEAGWTGTANPDGTLEIDGRDYPYLFWEGKTTPPAELAGNDSTGFIVDGKAAIDFLEFQLGQMGLNDKEQADFITYWGPRLAVNHYNFVRFVFNEGYNQFAELEITPKPDNTFRVFMLFTPLQSQKDMPEPNPREIPKMNRSGFTVVEWGGAEMPTLTVPN